MYNIYPSPKWLTFTDFSRRFSIHYIKIIDSSEIVVLKV